MSSLRVPMRGLQHRPPHQAKRSHPVFSSHRPQLRGPNPAWNLGDSVWRSVQKRRFHWWPVVAPPLIFTGLFIGLWCWKCTMLVLFQNMIIYNPFLPPNARSLRIQDYQRDCRGVCWREERIRSLDGTEIALCVSDVSPIIRDEREGNLTQGRLVYILYFQGKSVLFAHVARFISFSNHMCTLKRPIQAMPHPYLLVSQTFLEYCRDSPRMRIQKKFDIGWFA